MFNVVVTAHCPAVGVKVYTVVPATAVLTAGAHVPVIAGMLVDVVGITGAALPWQTFGMAANVGVIGVVMVMLKVVLAAHCPGLAVKL
jgi:hypothetical protein